MTVASDKTCVFTQVVIPCPYGELVAKAAMPRVFLVSSCAAQLSNGEVWARWLAGAVVVSGVCPWSNLRLLG